MKWSTNGTAVSQTRNGIPDGHTECAPRPADDYIINETWKDDPMDPAVCWRTKTAQEIDDEKTLESLKLKYPAKAFKSVLEILYENSTELQSAFASVSDFIQSCIDRYKSKL